MIASSATAYAISAFATDPLAPGGTTSDQTVVPSTVDDVKVVPSSAASWRRWSVKATAALRSRLPTTTATSGTADGIVPPSRAAKSGQLGMMSAAVPDIQVAMSRR